MKQIMNTTKDKEEKKSGNLNQRLQKGGLILAAISSTILALPFSLHPLLTMIVTVLGSMGSLLVAITKIIDSNLSLPKDAVTTEFNLKCFTEKNDVDKKAAA